MLPLLLRLQPFIPSRLFKPALDFYWNRFWINQAAHSATDRVSVRYSERATLIEAICASYPFSTILEVGCAYGQNLLLLGKLFPGAAITAVDKSQSHAEAASKFARELGMQNVTVLAADAEDLSLFPNRAFDIVFTSATLLYLRADKIDRAVSELLRVCRRKLILLEQHAENPHFPGQAQGVLVPRAGGPGGYWLRDYRKLLEAHVKPDSISFFKVPNPSWRGEQWETLAHLIEVKVGLQ
jgi:ubiquinone/menaquinone biosynthesis C-methylase UbiE